MRRMIADSTAAVSEKKSHWSVNGYLKDLQSIQFTDINKKWTLDNLVHNRVDVHWYADSLWKISCGYTKQVVIWRISSIVSNKMTLCWMGAMILSIFQKQLPVENLFYCTVQLTVHR